MQHIRPILTRDLRNQRWLLLAWILVLIASVASRIIGSRLPLDATANAFTGIAASMLAFAHLCVVFVGVALIVHTDVVVGSTAFWLTRPIARGTMYGAKLLAMFLILLLPALVIEAMLMAAFGVSPIPIALAVVQQAWFMLPFVLLFALGAAVTRSLPQLLLLAFAFFVALILYDSMLSRPQPVPVLRPGVGDPSEGIIAGTFFTCGLLVAVAFQYWRRQAALALLIGSVCVVATLESHSVLSEVSLFGSDLQSPQESWSTAPLILKSGERVTWPALRQSARIVADDFDQWKLIAAPLTIEGLPEIYTTRTFTTEATLRFAKATITSAPAGADGRIAEDEWPVILNVRNDLLRGAGDGPAAYHAAFFIDLIRHDRLATVPLAPGAGANDGTQSMFVRDFRELRGSDPRCLVRLDVTSVNLLMQPGRSTRLEAHARRADGSPVQTVLSNEITPADRSFGILPSAIHPFALAFHYVDIVAPRCEGLQIDIDRVSFAGRLRRTIDLPEVNVYEIAAKPR